jgi:hypothetical protein
VKTIATKTHESLEGAFEKFGVSTQTFTKD